MLIIITIYISFLLPHNESSQISSLKPQIYCLRFAGQEFGQGMAGFSAQGLAGLKSLVFGPLISPETWSPLRGVRDW